MGADAVRTPAAERPVSLVPRPLATPSRSLRSSKIAPLKTSVLRSGRPTPSLVELPTIAQEARSDPGPEARTARVGDHRDDSARHPRRLDPHRRRQCAGWQRAGGAGEGGSRSMWGIRCRHHGQAGHPEVAVVSLAAPGSRWRRAHGGSRTPPARARLGVPAGRLLCHRGGEAIGPPTPVAPPSRIPAMAMASRERESGAVLAQGEPGSGVIEYEGNLVLRPGRRRRDGPAGHGPDLHLPLQGDLQLGRLRRPRRPDGPDVAWVYPETKAGPRGDPGAVRVLRRHDQVDLPAGLIGSGRAPRIVRLSRE